jgi:hypothetical protein
MSVHRSRITIVALVTFVLLMAGFGGLAAFTAMRLQAVELKTHIQICQKTENGTWEVIDEVGPANLNFEASLIELANGKKVSSQFLWQTRTKKGRSYSVRLLEPAQIDFNPITQQFNADLIFEVTLDNRKARVQGKLTTESHAGPRGVIKGQRAQGLFGQNRTSLTLVSANEFGPVDGSEPLMLVCRDEYTFTPKK